MKLSRVIVLFVLVFSISGIRGQNVFQKILGGAGGEGGSHLIDTKDNGFMLYGQSTSDSFGDNDLVLVKMDSVGDVQWATHFGTEMRDLAQLIIPYDENYLGIGWVNQGGSIDDMCFFIVDKNGTLLNYKTYGLSSDDEVFSVVQMNGEKFAVTGQSSSFGVGGYPMFISTFDKKLNLAPLTVYSNGGLINPRRIIYTKGGNLAITGFTSVNYPKGFVIKTDTLANIIWGYRVGAGTDTRFNDIVELADGSLVCVGKTKGYGANSSDVFFLRFSSEGNLVASKILGGNGEDFAFSVLEASDGNLIVISQSSSFGNGKNGVSVFRLDVNGNFLNGFAYGGDENNGWPGGLRIPGVKDNFVFAVSSRSYGAQNGDFLIVRTDENGESCCAEKIDIVGKDVTVSLDNLGFSKSSSSFPGKNYILQKDEIIMEDSVICASPISIVGPDTLFCENIGNYSVTPLSLTGLSWTVPEHAEIISNQNNINITINFNGESGMIYLLSNSCSTDTLDSLFVNVIGGELPDFTLGSDTSFCYGSTIILSPGGNFYHYNWQDGSHDTMYIADESGIYWVQITDSSGCSATDSITVETYPAFDFNLGNDTTICDGDYIFLIGPDNYEQYQWQDGSDFTSYIADTAGIYWLEVSDTNLCVARDSLTLQVNKVENFLGPDTLMCEAGSYTIGTNPKYEQYFWFDGSDDSAYMVSEKGKYWVTVIDSMGCTGTDTLNLDYFPALTLTLNSTGYLCEDDSVLLVAISNCNNYLWQDGSQNSTFIAKDSGTYWVRVTDPCETKSDTIVLDVCSSIWIPNVFTPNKDGYNDYFYAVGKSIPKFKMEIFNRWGQTLKVLYSLNEKWDGTYRGQKAAEGTYFWVVDYEQVNRDGSTKHIRQQGSVTLLR